MDVITMIAESKIREAMEKGELDNLPNKGQPLILEDLSHVPADLRAGYKILKNSNVLPEEIQLKKDIVTLQDLINCCYDNEKKNGLKKRLNEKVLRFNMLMEKRQINCNIDYYKDKIYDKLEDK
ncbi:DnaJ family domain-containing protein [Peptococcaceae bacterium 1198_IL3148]